MKRQTAALLLVLITVLACPHGLAERATIPYTMADFKFDRIRPVPELYTLHSEESMTTYVESDLPIERAMVNMNMNFVPVELDEGGKTFTYSTRGLKRQVGVLSSGTWRGNAFLEWVDMDECPTERDALNYAGEHFSRYASFGYEADPSMFWEVEIFGVAADGTEALIEKRLMDQDDYKNVEDMTRALDEICAKEYPACAAFRFSVTDDFQGGWKLFAVGAASEYYFTGDDAYMIFIGNQASVHGRNGVPHTVYARTDRDLFDTDMECSGTTLTWKKNGNTGVWYVDTVEATYENSFTARISAHYLHDRGTSLVNYDITFINEGVTYTVHFSPQGKRLRATAEAPFGSFVSAGADSEWEWINTETYRYETSYRLLPLKELTLVRYH